MYFHGLKIVDVEKSCISRCGGAREIETFICLGHYEINMLKIMKDRYFCIFLYPNLGGKMNQKSIFNAHKTVNGVNSLSKNY